LVWRRTCGAWVMSIGASTAVAGAALAGVALATRLEWHHAPIAVSTLEIAIGSALAGGSVLTLLGRWIYGEWNERAPVMRIASLIAQAIGVVVAVAMGGLFIALLLTGVEPEDRPIALVLAAGMGAGFLALFLGCRLDPSRRSNKFVG
jgi:hypothetical protein